jgi:hypothetical protein
MMKNTILYICCFVSTICIQYYWSWWCLVFPSMILGYFQKNSKQSFLKGFSLVFTLWLLLCLFFDNKNHNNFSDKISLMLFIDSKYLLFFLISTSGGIYGGISSILGYLVKDLVVEFKKSK